VTEQRRWTAVAVSVASAIAVCAIAARTHQSLYSDPALQMKTVVQALAGTSPRVNDWIRPDYDDLSRDADERLVIWAPGTPLAFLPFVGEGLAPASAARAVAVLALVAGAAGWTWWFAGFGLARGLVLAFAVLVPWIRAANNSLFVYSNEVLLFATVPWVLVAALAAERTRGNGRWASAIGVGLAAGLLYVVKYSASFVTGSILVWGAWRAWRSSDEPRVARAARLVIVAFAAAVPVLALNRLNQQGGSANLITATWSVGWQWQNLLHAVSFPALTAADLDSLLRYLLMHPVHGITQDAWWLTVAGLPGGVLIAALAVRATRRGAAPDLARVVLAVSVAALVIVWTISPVISVEARHVMSAGLTMLPLALAEGFAWRATASRGTRRTLGAAAIVFVALPLAYGVTSVFAKVVRYPRDYRPGASGVYNPLLAQHDAASVVDALAAHFDAAHDVWYLTDPLTALDLPGRAIVRNADFAPLDLLRRDRFVSSRAIRIHALLPPRFEENGKGAAIRASFPQATRWTVSPVRGAEYVEWTAALEPAGEQ
jgi:hypothetical protein